MRLRAGATALLAAVATLHAAWAAPAPGAVAGTVTDAGGAPVARARVTVVRGTTAQTSETDARGTFLIDGIEPGTVVLGVTAAGFEPVDGRTLDVAAGAVTSVAVLLQRSTTSLTTLGHVITRSGEALSTSSSPVTELDTRPVAARGSTSLIDVLESAAAPSTIVLPAGGNPAAPAAVALRGPDPTETLFEVDGHALNSGGSGTFDASLLDPAQLESVELVYGIAPGTLVGPNTIGGAVNVRTIDPTAQAHGLYRAWYGSFGSFGATLQATGTSDAIGYAVSAHRQTLRGETVQSILTADGEAATVASGIDAGTVLAKMRIPFGSRGGFVEAGLRDQSAYRDLSAALSSAFDAGFTTFNSFSGSASLGHNGAYDLDAVMPLGRHEAGAASPATLSFRHLTSVSDQSVVGPALGSDPFLNDERDAIGDDIVELDRQQTDRSFSLRFDLRTEALVTSTSPSGVQDQAVVHGAADVEAAGANPSAVRLAQLQRSAAARYELDTQAKLHYALALYASDFSTFGSSLDPRAGIVWTPTAWTSVRGSVGTTFQTPQLTELYASPVLPPPDAHGYFHVGNPHLTADRATDYDVGADHLVGDAGRTRVSFDWYRSNVRDASVPFVPTLNCAPAVGPPPPPQQCEAFQVNAGAARYEGVEFALESQATRALHVRAAYDVNACHPLAVAPQFQNGSLVSGEQFLGVPLQTAALDLVAAPSAAFDYEAGVRYAGAYNELNRRPFATVQAGVTWHERRLDVGLYGTNLTDVYDDRFTISGGGVPYGGPHGPIATDAFALQGRAVTLVITQRY